MLTGMATAHATDVAPAWRSPGFVMEEIVVTAEAPSSYYMEEIVVTARREDLPVRLAMRTRSNSNTRNERHF
jgi:hypothetical protein